MWWPVASSEPPGPPTGSERVVGELDLVGLLTNPFLGHGLVLQYLGNDARAALHRAPALLQGAPVYEKPLVLAAAHEAQEVVFDYAATGLTLRSHPLSFLRARLATKNLLSAAQLRDLPHGRLVRACGIVTMRQQPQTAKGVVFVTLEDETGSINVIVWKSLKEKQRTELLCARLLAVYGVWQRDEESGGQVRHLIAKRLVDLTDWLGDLSAGSRDFR